MTILLRKPFSRGFLVILFTSILFTEGCSPSKTGPIAMLWHNTTARYNGYFMASKQMKEFESKLYKEYDYNYNRILEVYPVISDEQAKKYKKDMQAIIEDASLPIQFHKNSKWADDAYICIGKARYYMNAYDEAIKSFKYVNSNSENDEARHRALIWLMRTYLDMDEMRKAREVANYLNQQDLSDKGDWDYAIVSQNFNNQRAFNIAKAKYYLKVDRYKKAALALGKVVDDIRDNDERARMYYLTGQIYQKLDADNIAYQYYDQVYKNNPPYKLWFYTKLNQALVTDLKEHDKTAADIIAFYRNLLKDEKNEDFHDKIYYEMGRFEMKRDSVNKAIENYNKSLRASNKQNFIKAFSYLSLAQIYYENKKQYRKAKKYYDSTVTIMEKSYPEYPPAKKKQETLLEFVEQLEIVQTQDSLQKMAAMDSVALRKHLDSLIAMEEKRQKEAWEKQQEQMRKQQAQARNANNNNFNQQGFNRSMGTDDDWYFYSESMLARGRQEFSQKWGDRPLEDDWRRSQKQGFREEEEQPEEASADTTIQEDPWKIDKEKRRKEYYDAIPLTKREMDSSNAKLAKALFKLGQIYNQKLEETDNAIQAFKRHLNDFPQHKLTPEVLYSLYIIYKNKKNNPQKAQYYKDKLIAEYPHSIYAKLAENPDYLKENALRDEKVKKLYARAFDHYKDRNFLQAKSILDTITKQYPGNTIDDKINMLKVIITGHTQNILAYKHELKKFIEKYKTSPLKPRAKKMLAKCQSYMKEAMDIKGDTSKLTFFNINLNYPHYFIVSIPNDAGKNVEKLATAYRNYNKEYFSMEELKVETKPMDSTVTLLVVKEFPNKIQAMNYYEAQTGKSAPVEDIRKQVRTFTITADNFPKLLESGDVEGYYLFFRQNYM